MAADIEQPFEVQRGPLGGPALVGACAAGGALAALAFGYLMYFLVYSSELSLSDTINTQFLDFVRLKRDESAERRDRKPERPPITDMPDTPPMADRNADAGSELAVSMSGLDLSGELGVDGGLGAGTGSGEYLPIVKVAPIYPRRALVYELTGTCTVRYTVTTSGTVKDVEVVPGECAHTVFEAPSIDAAKRFRYKPRVIDGVAVEVPGVHNMFIYEIPDDTPPGGGP